MKDHSSIKRILAAMTAAVLTAVYQPLSVVIAEDEALLAEYTVNFKKTRKKP